MALLVRKLKAPNRQPPGGRERGCVSTQGEGVGFSEEEGGGVFVVAEGEGSASYDLATLVNAHLIFVANKHI